MVKKTYDLDFLKNMPTKKRFQKLYELSNEKIKATTTHNHDRLKNLSLEIDDVINIKLSFLESGFQMVITKQIAFKDENHFINFLNLYTHRIILNESRKKINWALNISHRDTLQWHVDDKHNHPIEKILKEEREAHVKKIIDSMTLLEKEFIKGKINKKTAKNFEIKHNVSRRNYKKIETNVKKKIKKMYISM